MGLVRVARDRGSCVPLRYVRDAIRPPREQAMRSYRCAVVMCVLALGTGCGGDRVGPKMMAKLEGALIVGMEANFWFGDEVFVKSKGDCTWRLVATECLILAEPVDPACDR